MHHIASLLQKLQGLGILLVMEDKTLLQSTLCCNKVTGLAKLPLPNRNNVIRGQQNVYSVCGNTMCISTSYVDLFLED